MFRGLYIAGTGMMLQRRKMETITNNIVNAETNGYKKDELVSHTFDDVMLRRLNDNDGYTYIRNAPAVGPLNFGTQVDQVYTIFTPGNYQETGRTTDMLIVGDGFFVMETENGERYSKAGAFTLTADGYLTDGDGNYVMGENGRIYTGGSEFAVDELGNVMVNGQTINRLSIVTVADTNDLRKEGHNLYTAQNGVIQDPGGSIIKQGFIENSNVEVARETVDMMTVYRAYETNQKMVTMIDETIGKAVNEIGRLR